MACCAPCGCGSPLRRPARCTSATRGRHCTTGCWPAVRAAQLVLRIEDTDRERSTPENVELIFDGAGVAGDRLGRGADLPERRTPSATPRSSSSCSTTGTPTARTAGPDEVKAYKAANDNRGFRGADEGEGAVRLRMPDEGATVVNDVIRGETAFENVLHGRPRDRPRRRHAGLPPGGRGRRRRRRDHPCRPRRRPLLQHAQAAAHLRGDGCGDPVYAHLPLLHGPDGKKLSKRHGAASVQDLREFRVPARGSDQLPRAARLGLRRDDDVLHASRSSRSCSRSSASRRTPRCSTSRSCAGSTGATCASCPSTS